MFINEYSRGVGIASEWQFLGDLALVFFVKHGKLDWCFFLPLPREPANIEFCHKGIAVKLIWNRTKKLNVGAARHKIVLTCGKSLYLNRVNTLI